jgi:class 3 adenylate cyclase
MSQVVVERHIDLRSDRTPLWCAVADTERLNRAIGLGKLEVMPISDSSAARFAVRTVSAGIPLEYDERPFEWVEGERFSVRRTHHSGVLKSMDIAFLLEQRAEGGTRVRMRIGIEPRYVLLSPILRIQVARMVDRIEAELRSADQDVLAGRSACFRKTLTPVDASALTRAKNALLGIAGADRQALALQLAHFVEAGSDADVSRIRPLDLAVDWKVDGRQLLSVCLSAVVVGLLELRWDLVCPSCRTANDRQTSLAKLPAEAHCQLCDISYEIELDRAIEATFVPALSLRQPEPGPFCIGGPMRTPHVVAQAILPARGAITMHAPDKPGRYRVFVRGGASAALEIAEHGAESASFRVDADGVEPKSVAAKPHATMQIAQTSDEERHVKLERLEWASRAATAHLVSTLPEFRRQFSADLLRPGVSLRVARVALLFTDLTDSTALYHNVGDAKAFKVVQEHFDVLSAIIARHRGTIVKTIGDAVMAAFVEERDALDAAFAMHRAFPAFRAGNPDASRTFLKVGVFAGPCYVVTANGLLDYFGQTVNIAARLQGASGAGEVVIDGSFADEAARSGWLSGFSISEHFDARFKGLPEPVRVARIVADSVVGSSPPAEAPKRATSAPAEVSPQEESRNT